MTSNTVRTMLTVVLLAGAVACAGADDGAAPLQQWQAETTTEGNVTTVRTTAGSVWGAAAGLEEDLSVGVDQGEQAYMFGRISGLSSFGDDLYVLDTSVPAIRVYDRDGRHLRDIGAEGDGPGEFRSPDGLLIDGNGRIYARDQRQARITVFENDGSFVETWPLDAGFVIQPAAFVRTLDGTIYSPGRIGERPEGMRMGGRGGMQNQMGMIPRGPVGTEAEPIPRPSFDYEPPRFTRERRQGDSISISVQGVPFAPDIVWGLAPSGALLAGVGTAYSFDITVPEGPVTRVVMDQEPVPVAAAERDWHIQQITARMRDGNPEWVWTGPEMPRVKPAFDQLLPDQSGRVWVGRPGPGIEDASCTRDEVTGIWEPPCWTNSRLYDVFDLEGAYLGSIDIPSGFRLDELSWIQGRTILAAIEDAEGVIRVKRYRLLTPAN